MPSSIDRSRDLSEIRQMIANLEETMKGSRNPLIARAYKKEIDELKRIISENSLRVFRSYY
jgi:hypothetical protein